MFNDILFIACSELLSSCERQQRRHSYGAVERYFEDERSTINFVKRFKSVTCCEIAFWCECIMNFKLLQNKNQLNRIKTVRSFHITIYTMISCVTRYCIAIDEINSFLNGLLIGPIIHSHKNWENEKLHRKCHGIRIRNERPIQNKTKKQFPRH